MLFESPRKHFSGINLSSINKTQEDIRSLLIEAHLLNVHDRAFAPLFFNLPYTLLARSSNHGEDQRDEKVSLFDSGHRGGGLRLLSVLQAPQMYPRTLLTKITAVAEP